MQAGHPDRVRRSENERKKVNAVIAAFCSCCDRRSATDACWCGSWFCKRCKLCVPHCTCATPDEWVDAGDELDDTEAKPGTGHTPVYAILSEITSSGAIGSVVYSRVLYSVGEMAGFSGKPRDWTMPDEWHRG
jgi:hypothetical protein